MAYPLLCLYSIQRRASDRLGSRDLNLTAIEIIEFPWAHLYPEGEWSERLAWSCPRIASPRDWIRIFFHEAFGVETDPRVFSSVRYVYKRSNVPRTVTSKDSVTPQIWYVCLGEKENTVHHYSLIRSLQNLSGEHVTSEYRLYVIINDFTRDWTRFGSAWPNLHAFWDGSGFFEFTVLN